MEQTEKNIAIANLVETLLILGYSIENTTEKIVSVGKINFFDDNCVYFTIEDNKFTVVSTAEISAPDPNKVYYKLVEVEEGEKENIINHLLSVYESFFNISNSSSDIETRYNAFLESKTNNIKNLQKLIDCYNLLGLDTNSIYVVATNNDKKTLGSKIQLSDLTLKKEIIYIEAIMGYSSDLSSDSAVIENIYNKINFYSSELDEFEEVTTNKTTGTIIQRIEALKFKENDNYKVFSITNNDSDYSISKLIEEINEKPNLKISYLTTIVEKLKDNLTKNNIVKFDDSWDSKPLDEKIDFFKGLFTKNNLSIIDIGGTNYNFIDITAVNRVKEYIDEKFERYVEDLAFSDNFNQKINNTNQKLSTITEEIYDNKNITFKSRIDELEEKTNELKSTLESVGYNIAPTYNVKLPKSSEYLYSDANGKAVRGFFSDVVEPNDYSPITSEAVYNHTKLFHCNGDIAGFGKITKQNTDSIIYNINNYQDIFTYPTNRIRIKNNKLLFESNFIYIPVIRGGILKIVFNNRYDAVNKYMAIISSHKNLLKLKEFMDEGRAVNFSEEPYNSLITDKNPSMPNDNSISISFNDENILKRFNRNNYIILLNYLYNNNINVENTYINSIEYFYTEDNSLRITDKEIIANNDITLETNHLKTVERNGSTKNVIKYTFVHSDELNSLITN